MTWRAESEETMMSSFICKPRLDPVCVTAAGDRIKTRGLEKIRRKYGPMETVESLTPTVDF